MRAAGESGKALGDDDVDAEAAGRLQRHAPELAAAEDAERTHASRC